MTKQQFIEAVASEQESLRRFLRGLCGGDGFLADDIAQEALLKAYISFERFEWRSRFSTWLFRVAYNCYYDHVKKSGKEEFLVSLDDGAGVFCEAVHVEDEVEKCNRNEQLYDAIRLLNRQEQAVILLFYMEDKSIKDIEVITGMPSGTIRSHLSRGRQHLKQYLESLNR